MYTLPLLLASYAPKTHLPKSEEESVYAWAKRLLFISNLHNKSTLGQKNTCLPKARRRSLRPGPCRPSHENSCALCPGPMGPWVHTAL